MEDRIRIKAEQMFFVLIVVYYVVSLVIIGSLNLFIGDPTITVLFNS